MLLRSPFNDIEYETGQFDLEELRLSLVHPENLPTVTFVRTAPPAAGFTPVMSMKRQMASASSSGGLMDSPKAGDGTAA